MKHPFWRNSEDEFSILILEPVLKAERINTPKSKWNVEKSNTWKNLEMQSSPNRFSYKENWSKSVSQKISKLHHFHSPDDKPSVISLEEISEENYWDYQNKKSENLEFKSET